MSRMHTDESKRKQQVKFRAESELVDQFDAMVEESDEHEHRASALRSAMRRMIGASDETHAPRQPPHEEELRTAYLSLVSLCNYAGIVPHEIATTELSTQLAKSQKVVERRILGKLRRRGYLRQLTNVQGSERAWQIRGVDS